MCYNCEAGGTMHEKEKAVKGKRTTLQIDCRVFKDMRKDFSVR